MAIAPPAALEGADHIVLEGAKHTPLETKDGSHWYGSGPYLDTWVDYLQPPAAEVAAPTSPEAAAEKMLPG